MIMHWKSYSYPWDKATANRIVAIPLIQRWKDDFVWKDLSNSTSHHSKVGCKGCLGKFQCQIPVK